MHGRRQLDFGDRCRAGLAVRVLAAVLCGVASAGPAAAQTTHADLETAVAAFTEALVLRGGLRGRRVIVGPRYFFDEDSKRRLPLSEFLSRQFQARLLAHDVTPVEPGGNEDEDRMMVLHGRWRLLGERLHLTVHVREPIVEGSGTIASAPPARVRDFDESLLALDLGFLGRDMVRQLEGGIRDGRHRDIHLGEFTIEGEGVGDSEPVRRYLTAFWLRPAFRDSLFTLRSGVPVGGEGHGVLFVYAYATSEHLKVSMHVEGAGERVPSATVDVPVELVPVLGGPDIEAMLARCGGQVEAGRLREGWSCYGEVPETAAGSVRVRAGRERIEERYADRVREALGAEDFETAEGVVGELSGLVPRPGLAGELKAEVAQAREAAEGERLAREVLGDILGDETPPPPGPRVFIVARQRMSSSRELRDWLATRPKLAVGSMGTAIRRSNVARYLEGLGVSTQFLRRSDVFPAMERGVIDGVATMDNRLVTELRPLYIGPPAELRSRSDFNESEDVVIVTNR